eukprot:TRINITY_DN2564_c0_g1_i7.p1 TRINITY_DN2564_c0_g1~~TRINITY_DN2564_c0_g1_i7.p1  ORF type:complete len:833 (-),score=92.10 TRINITY_DN2564_c0_g1_i7:1192-3594(-)
MATDDAQDWKTLKSADIRVVGPRLGKRKNPGLIGFLAAETRPQLRRSHVSYAPRVYLSGHMATDDAQDWKTLKSADIRVVGPRLGKRKNPGLIGFDGADAAVYPITCRGSSKLFAMKVLFNYGTGAYLEMRRRFEQEYRIPEALPRHPYIIKIFTHFVASLSELGIVDFVDNDDVQDTTMVLVMELGEQTLKACLEERRLSFMEICYVLSSLVRSVEHLLCNKVAHCDIKADNVVQTSDGRWALIDFGHAKDWNTLGLPAFTWPLLDGRAIGGAACVLAPEIINAARGSTIDYGKQDLFSVGCLVYALCGSQSPFEMEQLPFRSQLQYHVQELPQLPSEFVALQDISNGLLQADPARRFPAVRVLTMIEVAKTRALLEPAFNTLYGRGVRQDWRKGLEMLRPLCAFDHSAMMVLGLALVDGICIDRNEQEGCSLLLRCNHPAARWRCLCEGWGVTLNKKKAFAVAYAARDLSEPCLDAAIGYSYHYGIGVRADMQKANTFYRAAAGAGHVLAGYWISTLAECADTSFLQRAAAAGLELAELQLNSHSNFPDMQLLERGVAVGHVGSIFTLGAALSDASFESNRKRGAELLARAAALGHTPAATVAPSTAASDEDEVTLMKTLVVGEGYCGKTAFVDRLVNNAFSRTYKFTCGVDFALKEFTVRGRDGRMTTLQSQLWDTAGQERFASVNTHYFRGATGALVVCSQDIPQSFERLLMWKDLVNKHAGTVAGTVPCLLVVNKCDLIGGDPTLTDDMLDAFCKQHGFIGWKRTSAFTGEGINEAALRLLQASFTAWTIAEGNL